ncbi:MAG: hypothetical protein PVH88_06385 [Ignavibacteria bacterium]|jgi:hypothetical protein
MGKIYPVYGKKLLAALFFLLSFSMYNAQVVIEEEIEIKVFEKLNMTTSDEEHTITATLSWDESEILDTSVYGLRGVTTILESVTLVNLHHL